MRKIRKRKHMRILALILAAIVAVTTASVSVEARSVKPKLNKTRLKIVKGKTAKLKIRNVKSKKIRKTVWTVNKSGKKVVAFTKKSNTSITLKGKKKGTARITAKIKVGRKVYKRTARVTVKLLASDKEDPDDEEEDEVEIEEDTEENTGEDAESISTKTPNPMPNTPEPVPTETEPAVPVATEDMPDFSDTSKPVIPLRGLTFFNVPEKLGCGDPEAETEGRSSVMQVAYEPKNATQRDLVWKSSDETLATVDANGLVTANSKGRTGMVTITAICKENATISASVIIEIYSLQPVSEDYSVLDSPDTKVLPKGKITGAGQTPVSDVDTFKLQNGQLKGTFNDRNENIVLDLGRQIDVSKYGGVEIEGIVPGQLSLEFYDSSFDMYQTKDNGYDTDWWETTVGKTYPFYVGSCPWRYEGGGVNYLKLAENGYRGADYPDDPQSVLPAEESMCFSLDKLTDERSSGLWDKVRYIVIKSNQNPLLSSQYTFDRKTEVPYTITDLKFLAEEVVDDMDQGHFIIYNSGAEDAALNVASSDNNVTSYYADMISKDKPADKRDTTMNLSRMKYIKVKVKDTDTVKLSLIKHGDEVEDAVVVGEEDGSGDRSVYFSLDDVDEEDLENVDQICVETAVGGRVTWVSATRGEISYKLDGSEKKIEVKDGKATEVTLEEYGTEDPGWTPGTIVTAKPSVAPMEPTNMPNPPKPSYTSGTAAPYVLTISEEMEADGTKDKEDYRRDVDWSVPGQVTFTNVNGYNGGLMLKLQENGQPMDMSDYKYIEADVETWAEGGDDVFLKSFTDSSSIWDTIDNGKFEDESKEGRRTVRFDITDYRKALKSIAAIMISPRGDGTSDVQTALTLYNVRFVPEGWEDEPEEKLESDAEWEELDLSAMEEANGEYDAETGSMTVKDVEYFRYRLPSSVNAGQKVFVRLKAKIPYGSPGFRSWLVDEYNTTLASNYNETYNSTRDEACVPGKIFETEYVLDPDDSARYLFFKGINYGTNIDKMTIYSIQVYFPDRNEEEPEETLEPDAEWEELDLSAMEEATGKYDAETGSMTVKDVEYFRYRLPSTVNAGQKVFVRLKAKIPYDSPGFRSWLVDANNTTLASNYNETYNSTRDEACVPGKIFETEYVLNPDDSARYLFFKGINYGTNIDKMTIYSIQVYFPDRNEDEPEDPSTKELTVYENCAILEGLENKQWNTVMGDLAEPFTINPGDKVEVSISVKDADGKEVKDMDAAVMFSTETNGNELWSNRIDVRTGQNPEDETEWRWVKSDGTKIQIFNTLEDPVTVKGVAIQTANVSPTADPSEDEKAVFTVSIDKVWVTAAEK